MTEFEASFAPFQARMVQRGLNPLSIEAFRRHYAQLWAGDSGSLSETSFLACPPVPDLATLPDYSEQGRQALARTVMIKLNGGLGTGMGLDRAKSLLPVKPGYSFLSMIARHVLYLRAQYGVNFPLLLMNSFKTEADSLAALTAYPDLAVGWPLSFVQSHVPKIDQVNLQPVNWPSDPTLEWCPPGHGDIYTALVTTGWLDRLLAQGYEYAYVSNADNLGSMMDVAILGYFVQTGSSFMMEVADRTTGDRKGGHLARYQDGRWLLRELAQCPPDEQESFQDITRYAYFNTNNIWWHLPSLAQKLRQHGSILNLPLIRNRKRLDPTRPDSPSVYQLETAIGAAIEVFEDAQVLKVPRSRQIAIKQWSDLLVIWSDSYLTAPDGRIVLNPACQGHQPVVQLDPRYYSLESDIHKRFPYGIPSLVGCRRLKIEGEVIFGRQVTIQGDVSLKATGSDPLYIPDGAAISTGTQISH